jgi:hypothetical protein
MQVGTFEYMIIFMVVVVLAFLIAFAVGRCVEKRHLTRSAEREH